MRPLSYQLYSSRNFPPLSATLAMVAEVGYAHVEGYGGLFADRATREDLRASLDRSGLTMPTAHIGLDQIEAEPRMVVETAKSLGIEAVFVPAIEDRQKTAAGWADLGARLAEAGKPLLDQGIAFGWHNHDFEFAALDGPDRPLDLILGHAPDLALELDAAWAYVAGEDPIAWIQHYRDRLLAIHVKDRAPEGENQAEDGWADVGQGSMDWRAILAASETAGVKYLVLEHDNPADDRRFATRSFAAVQAL